MTTHDQKVVTSGQTQGFIENELPAHQSIANCLIKSAVWFLNTLILASVDDHSWPEGGGIIGFRYLTNDFCRQTLVLYWSRYEELTEQYCEHILGTQFVR